MGLERHFGVQVTFVISVEIDLEITPDVRLVVGRVVERIAINLDRAVVSRRIHRRGSPGDPDHRTADYQRNRAESSEHDAAPCRQPAYRS